MPLHSPLLVLILLLLILLASAAAAADPMRIMPLGDSITQGNQAQDSYRRPLWHALVKAGYAVDFIGSEQNFTGPAPHPDFDQDNEGHYGWTHAAILEKLDGWLAANRPDVVLLHLGTNDADKPVETVLDGTKAVIEAIRKANPEATILVAQLCTVWGSIEAYNRRLPELVASLEDPRSRIIVVDQATGFDGRQGFDTVDGCHPNESGEAKLAKRWFAALQTVLPAPATH